MVLNDLILLGCEIEIAIKSLEDLLAENPEAYRKECAVELERAKHDLNRIKNRIDNLEKRILHLEVCFTLPTIIKKRCNN